MAGLIPQNFIEDLLYRSDIVQIVGDYLPLKKAGKDYTACCPFHNEKTPSFSVSREKQFYYCFGCHASGSVLNFIMEFERISFPEAIEVLAEKNGVSVPKEEHSTTATVRQRSNQQHKQQDFELMQQVSSFYEQQLKQSSTAIEYLKQRGISGKTAKQFALGFATEQWSQLDPVFSQYKKQLLELKLLTYKNNTYFDFFRQRIMFPIRNKRGSVVGFGGRLIEGDGPKYLNSPETRLYHKSIELYGLYEAKQQQTLEQIIIVEGYMDVIALAEHGVHYAVASLGTAVTVQQMQGLFRLVNVVTCCFDGDRAGRQAAWKALMSSLSWLTDGKSIRFLFLPEGEDPDSQIRKEGRTLFEKRLFETLPLANFIGQYLSELYVLTNEQGRAEFIQKINEIIPKIPSDYYQDQLIGALAPFVRLEKESLILLLKKQIPAEKKLKQQKLTITPMRRAIALLLQYPGLAKSIPFEPAYKTINIAGFPLLIELQEHILKSQQIMTTGQLLECFRGTEQEKILIKLAGLDLNIEEVSSEHRIQDFQQTFHSLENQYLEYRSNELLQKAGQGSLTKEEMIASWELIKSTKYK